MEKARNLKKKPVMGKACVPKKKVVMEKACNGVQPIGEIRSIQTIPSSKYKVPSP